MAASLGRPTGSPPQKRRERRLTAESRPCTKRTATAVGAGRGDRSESRPATPSRSGSPP